MAVVFAQTTTTFRAGPRGGYIRVIAGDPWDADDPFVVSHPELFGDAPPGGVRRTTERVEKMTAKPGETRKAKKRTTKKK